MAKFKCGNRCLRPDGTVEVCDKDRDHEDLHSFEEQDFPEPKPRRGRKS